MSRFTRLSHPALLVLTGLVCLAAPRRVPAAGYAYSLFDGKTLNGWTIENDTTDSLRPILNHFRRALSRGSFD